MIAKVCDRESRRDTWFENRLVLFFRKLYLFFPLILALRVGESPTREGPGYATFSRNLNNTLKNPKTLW